MLLIIYSVLERYDVVVNHQYNDKCDSSLPKETKGRIKSQSTFEDVLQYDDDDPNVMEMYEHDSAMMKTEKIVPTFVLPPIVNITWLYLLKPFRDLMDFNFKRAANWNDDCQVSRFNDCWYVTLHNILDWHDFALLGNGSMLHKGVIVETPANDKGVVFAVEYDIPDHIINAKSRSDFKHSNREKFWKAKAILHFKKLKERRNFYELQTETRQFTLRDDDKLKALTSHCLNKPIRDINGQQIEIKPPVQHRDVANCKPFFFTILGSDEYHHTTFTGKNDSDTHGVYWWFGNMIPEHQFSRQLTMIMAQMPHAVPTNIMIKIIYQQWIDLIKNGAFIWTGFKFRKAYGMVSHQISDMKEADVFRRRRGNNKKSRCDAGLYLGYYHGCKWPNDVSDLMQLGIIMPGPYLLKLWKHLNFDCVPELWLRFPNVLGKEITLTTSMTDVYNRVPFASSLKTTPELNHTVLLGSGIRAVRIEYMKAHLPGNCNKEQTRLMMNAYLDKYFNNINGMKSILMRDNTKITVFNQMHQNYQKLIEILMAFPVVLSWYGNIALLTSFIRVIGLLFTVKSENQRKRVQKILIPILQASFVKYRFIHFLEFKEMIY